MHAPERIRPVVVIKGRAETVDTARLRVELPFIFGPENVRRYVVFRLKYDVAAIDARDNAVVVYTYAGCKEERGPLMRMCESCGRWAETNLLCAACYRACYCNAECQARGWGLHRRACALY